MVKIKCGCGHQGDVWEFEPGPKARRGAMWQCPKCGRDITRDEIAGKSEGVRGYDRSV